MTAQFAPGLRALTGRGCCASKKQLMKGDGGVDSFLGTAKEVGTVDGSRSSFTIKPSLAREKIVASRPIVDRYTILRLLDAGLAEWGYLPSKVTKIPWWLIVLQVRLPDAGKDRIATLLEELDQPFSRQLGATRLAQAIFLAAKKKFYGRSLPGQFIYSNFLSPA